MKPSVVFFGAIALLCPLSEASGFIATCRKLSFSGNTLKAECRQMNNQWRPTSLRLSLCVSNECGALKARQNVSIPLLNVFDYFPPLELTFAVSQGNYDRSCRSCSVSSDGWLKCQCGSCGGSWLDVRYNLSE